MTLFKKKRRRPVFDRKTALAMIPARNSEVTEKESADGLIELAYPLAIRPWYGDLASKVGLWDGKPMTKRIELDRMGTYVWKCIDSYTSAQSIADKFTADFQVQPREAELSIAAFIKTLGERGIIGLRLEDDEILEDKIG